MSNFRDNPSNAEMVRSLTPPELRLFHLMAVIGALGLLADFVILIGLFTGFIPPHSDITMWSIGFMLLSTPVWVVVMLTGIKRGRDRRPGVMETFAAGGRR